MDSALEQNVNLVNALTQLGTYAFGSPAKTTTGGTTTKQTMFDPTATSALIQQLLGASGLNGTGKTGMVDTTRMSKSAGLYNSSTQDLLNNDLLSRITGEISIIGAPTVTQNPTTTTKQAGMLSGMSSLLTPLALMSMTSGGRKILKSAMKPINDLSDTIADSLGFGTSTGVGGAIDAGINTGIAGVSSADMAAGLLPASALSDMGVGSTTDAALLGGGFGAAAGTLEAANLVGASGGDALGSFIAGNTVNWGLDAATTAAVTDTAATAAGGAGIWETIGTAIAAFFGL